MSEIILLPKISDPRGNLTFIEGNNHIPFEIKRAYWIYDVPGGETRGGHAFKQQDEFIIAISGSFDVVIDDGNIIERVHLNRSYKGINVKHGKWRYMDNFSTNSLALVLASTYFLESDYIRSYSEFLLMDSLDLVDYSKNIDYEGYVEPKYNSKYTKVNDCKVIELSKNHRDKGNITVVENKREIPFDINRVYYLYDIPGGEERGGHAHKNLYQLIVAAGGSFDVELDDGINRQVITLNRPYQGLLIVPGIWRELRNFSSGSTCLVMASDKYDENDYIRNKLDYSIFKSNKNDRI